MTKQHGRLLGPATELGMTLGLTAAGLTILGLLLGRWLDARLGTRPWGTLLALVVGALAGQVAMYRLAIRASRHLETGAPQPAPDLLGRALRVLGLVLLPGIVGLGAGIALDRLLGMRGLLVMLLTLGGLMAGSVAAVRVAWHTARDGRRKD